MILKLIDGGIIDIREDKDYISGCPTCDYGSCYIDEFYIELTTLEIHIEVSQMYDYPLSEGQMMKILLPNSNLIQGMTEEEFSKWLEENIKKEVSCNIEYNVNIK